MLKADLHLHAGENERPIKYNAKELIDKAADLGFDVLAFTFHDIIFYPKELVDYAKQKGILLIQGVEKTINGKHVLLYNITEEEFDSVGSLEDLKKLSNNSLILAPHPYYFLNQCLKKDLERNIDLFHGIEHTYFYNKLINPNKRAIRASKKYNKTLVGGSDTHRLNQLNTTYSLIDAEKNIDSVIEAIKKGRVQVVSKPLSFGLFSEAVLFTIKSFWHDFFGKR